MIGTKLIAATVAGAAVGAGTFALTPTQAATGSPTSSSDSARHGIARQHRDVIHGSWVTRDRVHHEAIRGVVRTVNPSYITVRAADGYVQTYHVGRDTKVRVLGDGTKGLDKITDVKVGYEALVAGVGNDQARHVVAHKPKAAASS
jgi:hypothetical protein